MKTCKKFDFPWAIIGGVALPAYKVTQTTLDLDIAVYFSTQQELTQFVAELKKNSVHTTQEPKIDHLLFLIYSTEFKDEAEIWLDPCDAFSWDQTIIKRVRSIEGNSDHTSSTFE